MPFIKNNEEIANSITTSIESAALGFTLKAVSMKAADHVEVEAECSKTFAAGVKNTEAFKTHLDHAASFVSQVSMKLEEADEKASLNNQSALNIPYFTGDGF